MVESQPFTEEDVERYAARLCAMVCDYARDINPPLALDDCPLVNAHVTDVRALLASLCRDGRFLPPDCDVTNELAVLGEVGDGSGDGWIETVESEEAADRVVARCSASESARTCRRTVYATPWEPVLDVQASTPA